MQAQPGNKWDNGSCSMDGTWGTRGHNAIHGGVTTKALKFWGALLAFYAMSRNSKTNPFLTTSCTMERIGVNMMCIQLKASGFGTISIKIAIDGDTKNVGEIKKKMKNALLLLCSGS